MTPSLTPSLTHRARLKYNRPSLRERARPPKPRSSLGQAFSSANLNSILKLQHCLGCNTVQYPPRELCQSCLSDQLRWRESKNTGHIIQAITLHHSLWEFFKRRLAEKPWTIASIRLDCKVTVFAHLATAATTTDMPVQVFTHSDASLNSVIIAVDLATRIDTPPQRLSITQSLGLTEPAIRKGGI